MQIFYDGCPVPPGCGWRTREILPSCKLLVPSAVLIELNRIKKRSRVKTELLHSVALKIAGSHPVQSSGYAL